MSATKETFPVRFGDFALVSSLGVGGMGRVYLAAHPEWPELVVLKRLHPHLHQEKEVYRRFLHEAKTATHVRHPAVAGAIAVGSVGAEPFFATEYVFGLTLATLVDRMESGAVSPPSLGVGLYLALDLAKGLEAIHEAVDRETGAPLQLLHRDIGSRNVIIGFDGRLRIIDLGLGRSLLADWETAADTVSGSPDYMPPEQAAGERVDRRADVYSAAVTIFELLAGKKRIRAETVAERLHLAVTARPEPIRSHRPEASAELESALMAAMAPQPEQRTRHARILRAALEDELSRLSPRPVRRDVEQWLAENCAEDRRALSEQRRTAQGLAAQTLSGPSEETRIHAIAPTRPPDPQATFEHELPEATQPRVVAAAASRAMRSHRPLAMGLGLGLVLLAAVLALGGRRSPRFEPVAVPLGPAPSGIEPTALAAPISSVAPEADSSTTSTIAANAGGPTTPAAAPAPTEKPIAKPLSPALSARKQSLASRLQLLRRSRFDVPYQRQLTQIGQTLSRARSAVELDEVERRIRRLEANR